MAHDDLRIERLRLEAKGNHGIFSTRMALDCDVSYWMLRRLLESGEVEQVHPGAYAFRSTPESFFTSVAAACDSLHAVACGHSAAALYGLYGFSRKEIEVMVPSARNIRACLKGVRIRRTNYLPDEDVLHVHGISATSPARTLLDIGSSCVERRVRRAALEALDRKLVTVEQLADQLARAGRPGRPGTSSLRRVLADLGEGNPDCDSDLEEIALKLLVKNGYPEPTLHFVVYDGSALVGETDLFFRQKSLDVEVDSPAFHLPLPNFYKDRRRQNSLIAAGITVVRFTDEDARRPLRFLKDFARIWARL